MVKVVNVLAPTAPKLTVGYKEAARNLFNNNRRARRAEMAAKKSGFLSLVHTVCGNHKEAVSGPGSVLASVFVTAVHVVNEGAAGLSSVVLPVGISLLQGCLNAITDMEARAFVEKMGPFIKSKAGESPESAMEREVKENQQLCRNATSIAFAGASVCISLKRALFSELGAQVCSVLPPVTVMGQTFAPQVLGYHLFGALSNVTFEPMELEDGGHSERLPRASFSFFASAESLVEPSSNSTLSAVLDSDGAVLFDSNCSDGKASLADFSINDLVLGFFNGTVTSRVHKGAGEFCLEDKPDDCVLFDGIFSRDWRGFRLPETLSGVGDFCMTGLGFEHFCALSHRIPGLMDLESQAVQMYTQGYPTALDNVNVYHFVNALLRGDSGLIGKLGKDADALRKTITLTFLALSGINKSPLIKDGVFYRLTLGACEGVHNGIGLGSCKEGETTIANGITGASRFGPLTGFFKGNTLVIIEGDGHDVTGPQHMGIAGSDIELVPGVPYGIESARRFGLGSLSSNVLNFEHRVGGGHNYMLIDVGVYRKGVHLFTAQHTVSVEEAMPFEGAMRYFHRDPKQFEALIHGAKDPFYVLRRFYGFSTTRVNDQDQFDRLIFGMDPTPKSEPALVRSMCGDSSAVSQFLCGVLRDTALPKSYRIIRVKEILDTAD